MNKFTSLSSLVCLLLCLTTLTSCDEDMETSMVLSGQWEGIIEASYDYTATNKFTGERTTYTFNADQSFVEFIPDRDYATYGTGRRIDFYSMGPYQYDYHEFYWEIENGVIYIHYPTEPLLNTEISEYRLRKLTFEGYSSRWGKQFCLYKRADYYDWTPAISRNRAERSEWFNSYYAPTRGSISSTADSLSNVFTEGTVTYRRPADNK